MIEEVRDRPMRSDYEMAWADLGLIMDTKTSDFGICFALCLIEHKSSCFLGKAGYSLLFSMISMGKQGILGEEMAISPGRIPYWFPHNINKTFEVV